MSLRNKISFDMVTKIQSGTNWVKNLSNHIKCLNNEKHEELGSVFFWVYFGKNSNKLVCCGLSESWGSPEIKKVSKPTKNDFNRLIKLRLKTGKWAYDSDE